jgi:uncharacterized RDD family membrane protein YckC
MIDESKIHYAGFWRRLGALVLDAFIMILSVFLIYIILISISILLPGFEGHLAILSGALMIALLLFYHVYFLVTKGATPGKAVLGLIVVNKKFKYPISTGSALMREFLGRFIVDRLLMQLGNLLIIFDSRKQALHDKIGGTYVVFKDSLIEKREEDAPTKK